MCRYYVVFFFNDTATTEIYTLSLHDALPISLNPHPDEKLSDELLVQIAKEYMEALGYGKQPYIVFKHNDIAREHIHIVSLRVDSNRRKINDKFEGKRSKLITDALERKYGLIPSSKVSEKAVTETPKVDINKGNVKEQMASTLRMVLKRYRRSEEHTSELQSRQYLVCRLLLEKKK